MVAHSFSPVIPPDRPSEPETLVARYHIDLATLDMPTLFREEGVILARAATGARPSPRELTRLAGIAARLERDR